MADIEVTLNHSENYSSSTAKTYRGYVTALYPELNALNFQSPTKHCKRLMQKNVNYFGNIQRYIG